MNFLIAAAGTGGHVFPGLAVGEALVDLGVARDRVGFVGGDRLEAAVYPEAGFPFLRIELRGMERSLSLKNLGLPRLMWRARGEIIRFVDDHRVKAVLGMGGYVTIPAGLAARKTGTPLLLAEQNAGAGLANRVASRWAVRSFTSFPDTEGLESGEWVGNPVRKALAEFDRKELFPSALTRYRLEHGIPVLGVVGGSLGAGALNAAVGDLVAGWEGARIQLVHLTGKGRDEPGNGENGAVAWRRLPHEDRMELFYAAADLVVARAGGGVAELTATGTPSILVPGEFGSSGHQVANAAFLERAGAAAVLPESRIEELPRIVQEILFSSARLEAMRKGARSVARPEAARTVAAAMMELAR